MHTSITKELLAGREPPLASSIPAAHRYAFIPEPHVWVALSLPLEQFLAPDPLRIVLGTNLWPCRVLWDARVALAFQTTLKWHKNVSD